jgi:hypothetical protein
MAAKTSSDNKKMRKLTDVLKYFKKQRLLIGALACMAFLLAGWATWTRQNSALQNHGNMTKDAPYFETVTKAAQTKINEIVAEKEKAAELIDNTATPSAEQTKPKEEPKIKYSTSPDPRSTAYSTTPPQRSQEDVDIKITHFGQVAPGTLISYNATKNEKSYYAGDLNVSTPSVTISKSNSFNSAAFTVSAPDGKIFHVPSEPWNQHTWGLSLVMDSSVPLVDTSFPVFITLWDKSLAPGVYTVAFGSGPTTAPTLDGWAYMGFIDVIVTD